MSLGNQLILGVLMYILRHRVWGYYMSPMERRVFDCASDVYYSLRADRTAIERIVPALMVLHPKALQSLAEPLVKEWRETVVVHRSPDGGIVGYLMP
jgi:hypothetical protein